MAGLSFSAAKKLTGGEVISYNGQEIRIEK